MVLWFKHTCYVTFISSVIWFTITFASFLVAYKRFWSWEMTLADYKWYMLWNHFRMYKFVHKNLREQWGKWYPSVHSEHLSLPWKFLRHLHLPQSEHEVSFLPSGWQLHSGMKYVISILIDSNKIIRSSYFDHIEDNCSIHYYNDRTYHHQRFVYTGIYRPSFRKWHLLYLPFCIHILESR